MTVDWPAEQRLGALGTVWVARCALLLQAFHRTTGVRRACLEVLAAGSCCFAGGAALAWAHETWIRTLFRRLLMLEVCKGNMAQSEWCFLSMLGSRGAS